MQPVHVLPDSLKVALAYFRAAVADSDDPSTTDVTIGRSVKPTDDVPCVQLRLSTGTQVTPAHDNPMVDFLIWHEKTEDGSADDNAMALALVLRAYGRAADGDAAGPGRIMFDRELMRPTDDIDPVDEATPQVMFRQQFFIR